MVGHCNQDNLKQQSHQRQGSQTQGSQTQGRQIQNRQTQLFANQQPEPDLQQRQYELFQTQKKLDAYRIECEVLSRLLREHDALLNRHIGHYAAWLAKRNLMVQASGRNAPASKALIAQSEAACLRLETFVEGLRTGTQETQRRAFRVVKSQIGRAVNEAIAHCTATLLSEHGEDLFAFQSAYSALAPQGSGWQNRDLQPETPWLQVERVIDQLNLNVLQLERQFNFCKQSALQTHSKLEHRLATPSAQASPELWALNGFAHYAWMPSFYRSAIHFQILAEEGVEKSTFLNNFLGWIAYNIPRANFCISELTDKPKAWSTQVDYQGWEGVMRHWNEFQLLLETRLRERIQEPSPELVAACREHYGVFDQWEQSLQSAPQGTGSGFRSVLLAGGMPKMHLIFTSQSPPCGPVELTPANLNHIARIIVGETQVEAMIEHHGRSLFGRQLGSVKKQLAQWQARSQRHPAAPIVQANAKWQTDPSDLSGSTPMRSSSLGMIFLNQTWQFVLLPPAGYFVGTKTTEDHATRLQ